MSKVAILHFSGHALAEVMRCCDLTSRHLCDMGGTRADKWLSISVLCVFAVTKDFPFGPKAGHKWAQFGIGVCPS